MKKKQVTFLLPDLATIGAQRVAMDYALELQNRGFSVDLLVGREGSNPFSSTFLNVRYFGIVGVFAIPRLRVLLDFLSLMARLRASQSDIIISVTPLYNRYICFAKWLKVFSGKVVIEDHSFPPIAYNDEFQSRAARSFFRITEFVFSYADSLRVLSRECKEYYKELKCDVVVLPNFMDFTRLDGAQPIAKDEFDLVYIGRLESQKNIGFLIEAVEKLIARRNIKLLIIGYGSLKFKLLQLVQKKNLGAYIEFRDSSAENFSLLAGAKAFPLVSTWEGFPLVLIESMRLKVPVVSVDCLTGPKTLIGENERGWLVPENRLELFAEALEEVFDCPVEAARRATAAYEYVDQNLCIKKRFPDYIKLFIE